MVAGRKAREAVYMVRCPGVAVRCYASYPPSELPPTPTQTPLARSTGGIGALVQTQE